jgi:hypothetical protein
VAVYSAQFKKIERICMYAAILGLRSDVNTSYKSKVQLHKTVHFQNIYHVSLSYSH